MRKIISTVFLLVSICFYNYSLAQESIKVPSAYIQKKLINSKSIEQYLVSIEIDFKELSLNSDVLTKNRIQELSKEWRVKYRADIIHRALLFDINGNGKIEREEVEKTENQFDNLPDAFHVMSYDINKDNTVEYKEIINSLTYDSLAKTGLETLDAFIALDMSNDGSIKLNHIIAKARDYYDMYQANQDNVLSPAEKNRINPLLYQNSHQEQPHMEDTVRLADNEELHVVSVYQGNSITNGIQHAPIVPIYVDRPNQKVNLLLISGEPVKWEISTSPHTEIIGVFTNSTRASSALHIDHAIQILPVVMPFKTIPNEDHGMDFIKMLSSVKKHMGREKIDSFHGKYSAPDGGFIINTVENRDELKFERLKVTSIPPKESKLVFGKINGIFGYYDIQGKLKFITPKEITTLNHVKIGDDYYYLTRDTLIFYDNKNKKLTPITLPTNISMFDTNQITFNNRNNTIVLYCNLTEGILYEYNVKIKKWSTENLYGWGLSRLEYDATENLYISHSLQRLIYSIRSSSYTYASEPSENSIVLLNAKDSVYKTIPANKNLIAAIDDLSVENSQHDNNQPEIDIKLYASDSHYILVAYNSQFEILRIYTLDKKTLKASLTYIRPFEEAAVPQYM